MSRFFIHEDNMDRLNKKLETIKKKCNKNQMEFRYEVVGEDFRTVVDEETNEQSVARFIEVEVEGEVRFNGWRFVAVLDHHADGNVIRTFDHDLALPEKYKTCGPTCEHCNKIRSRKDTYVVYNDETQEFRQVGKSCLAEFTNGLDAEQVAFFVSIYDSMENAGSCSGSSFKRYNEVEEMVRYAWECYHHFGYERAFDPDRDLDPPTHTTRSRVSNYWQVYHNSNFMHSSSIKSIKEEMDAVGFDPNSEYAVTKTAESLEWIRSIDDPDNQYLFNLKVICSDDYTEGRNLGILVSLTTAYMHEMDHRAYEERKKSEALLQHEKEMHSGYQGNKGDKLSVQCVSFDCVTSFETQFGVTFLYKFIDADGNIFIWYASNPVKNPEAVSTVTGTVKDHNEFRGVKQTILTRCKVA